jgi:ribulose bisphosphate carboxylase small subunit
MFLTMEGDMSEDIEVRDCLYPDEVQGTGIVVRAFDNITWRTCYEFGYRDARYPLPAVRTCVEIEPDYCAVFAVGKTKDQKYDTWVCVIYQPEGEDDGY